MRGSLIAAMLAGADLEESDKERTPATAERIAELGKRYLEPSEFKPGDMVTWKEGLKHCRYPEYGEPAVVLEIMKGRRLPIDHAGGNHQSEPEEVRVGVVGASGDFQGFWLDANRLQLYHP